MIRPSDMMNKSWLSDLNMKERLKMKWRKQMEESRFPSVFWRFCVTGTIILQWLGAITGAPALGAPFALQKDSQGLIRPFKVKTFPLSEFTKEYSRLTGTHIEVIGKWETGLRGTVNLL